MLVETCSTCGGESMEAPCRTHGTRCDCGGRPATCTTCEGARRVEVACSFHPGTPAVVRDPGDALIALCLACAQEAVATPCECPADCQRVLSEALAALSPAALKEAA